MRTYEMRTIKCTFGVLMPTIIVKMTEHIKYEITFKWVFNKFCLVFTKESHLFEKQLQNNQLLSALNLTLNTWSHLNWVFGKL
jgi:intracellular septation protein A